MAIAADLVVVGRIDDVKPGREFGDLGETRLHYAAATVEVIEVLHTSAAFRSQSVVWEIPLPPGDGAPEVLALAHWVPRAALVLFLRNKATEVATGMGVGDPQTEAGFYRTVVGGAILADSEGVVALPVPPNESGFLTLLVGEDFEVAVQRVRTALRSGS